jgi:hypothetical protein
MMGKYDEFFKTEAEKLNKEIESVFEERSVYDAMEESIKIMEMTSSVEFKYNANQITKAQYDEFVQ